MVENTDKPSAPAFERNKEPILNVFKEVITPMNKNLLEVGSGTGQHAVYIAPYFKNLQWVTSDRLENHSGIKMWLDEYKGSNIHGPIEFELGKTEFPKQKFDMVFTANTFHIMSWKNIKTLIKMLGRNLPAGALFLVYGPFKYNGEFTTKSNEEFDKSLKVSYPQGGIRAFEDVSKAMSKNGFSLSKDIEMPANNRVLVFKKL